MCTETDWHSLALIRSRLCSRLEVTVLKAVNVIAADAGGTSDPYCKVNTVPAALYPFGLVPSVLPPLLAWLASILL